MNNKINLKNKTVAFITLGCKVNVYETNAMSQKFLEAGYSIVQHSEISNIYIINTCTVTNMSDRKSRQMLRKVKELNNNSIVVAAGCYAQVARKELEKIKEIDLIIGNDEKNKVLEIVESYLENNMKEKEDKIIVKNKNKNEINNFMDIKEYTEFGEITYTENKRAVIKVQDGCDRFCSYCIIPYARGRVRSRDKDNILSEVKKVVLKGVKEIVITGIHIASYGKDFNNNYYLIDLLEELNNIDGLVRIRLRIY